MIKTFADRRTRDLFLSGKARRFPPDIARRTARKLEYVDAVMTEVAGAPPVIRSRKRHEVVDVVPHHLQSGWLLRGTRRATATVARELDLDALPHVRRAAPVEVPQCLPQAILVEPRHHAEELLAVHSFVKHSGDYLVLWRRTCGHIWTHPHTRPPPADQPQIKINKTYPRNLTPPAEAA